MGAHTCQFGTVHKMCRCPKQHSIVCPTPVECKASSYKPKHKKEDNDTVADGNSRTRMD